MGKKNQVGEKKRGGESHYLRRERERKADLLGRKTTVASTITADIDELFADTGPVALIYTGAIGTISVATSLGQCMSQGAALSYSTGRGRGGQDKKTQSHQDEFVSNHYKDQVEK